MKSACGGERGAGGGGGYPICAWPYSYDHRPSHPYYAVTKRVGVSPTRQALLAPGAGERGESTKKVYWCACSPLKADGVGREGIHNIHV